jgi:serine/threonine protein kinase/tetratricopeptide (TPR) repeat protein
MINNRYNIIEKIGEGRSEVFSCEDKFFPEENIAIKILQYTASDSEISSFYSEYEILKRLSHPNIVSVFDIGTILNLDEKDKAKYKISENDKFITMEKVDGIRIDECSELNNESKLLNVIHQISLVLYYIHQANYIYFDLKPENILISQSSNGLKIKIIDFGLTRFYPSLKLNFVHGTTEYLAPEILKKEKMSFNVDLYSFGILLYQIAYHHYPFRNENDLEIFRAHIEKDFEFPSSKYSNKIISIIKKLLFKDPSQRYNSSLEIIDVLEQKITFNEKLNLTNPLKYEKRKNPNKAVDNFIKEDLWGRVAVLLGETGSGKSSFLEDIAKQNKDVIFIRTNNFISASNFWQQFFSRLLYSEVIYRSIDDSLVKYISLHIDDNSEELLVELKTIISKIASVANFTLIIDDFDELEIKNLEILLELFPILLANQIKIVVAVHNSSDMELPGGVEKEIIELKPFSDKETKKIIENSYSNFIDRTELENLLLSFSERTPDKITYFISELIAIGIIDFVDGKAIIKYDDSKITKLLASQDDVFNLINENIVAKELEILETISLFEHDISIELISSILERNIKSIIKIFASLREKNILKPNSQNRNPSYLNVGFKQFIYSRIPDVAKRHIHAGKIILEFYHEIDELTKVRQFELGKNLQVATEIINTALDATNIINFPQIKIKLLKKKLSYKLSDEDVISASLNLCEIYSNIGKYTEALKIQHSFKDAELSKYYLLQKKRLHGILLIKTGDIKTGIKLLTEVVDNLPNHKDSINLELASAFVELNDYPKTESICGNILKQSSPNNETIGRAQNLLGISNLYNKSDLNITLRHFKDAHKTYAKENNFNRIAGSEVNLGNIHNILGNFSKAEKHWNKALQLNRSIGNVEREANVLLSTGVFYFEHAKYEKAISIYIKAGDIFKGLGNKLSFGLVHSNLCETYLEISEYQKAFNSIEKANKIFSDLKNNDELVEVLLLEIKLFILIGNRDALNVSFDKIKKILPIKSDRGKLLYKFYVLIKEKIDSGYFNLDEVKIIKEKLYLNNDRLLMSELQLILAEEYLIQENFETSISFLNSKALTDICDFNQKYEARRLYLLSKIPSQYHNDPNLTKNFLLHQAYIILQNNSISELTLNVLVDLAEFYNERGNVEKAKEYAVIAEAIINYIRLETISKDIIKPLFENSFCNIIKKLDNFLIL